ncbi:DNA polymerase III subunit chi [Sulfitobacter sp. SK012]|uniref:DNA polymerase III subunit chi n=1 Tax=Sulfitobacter sp. SK012 TaxID=1389005 RepID=UPI000E0B5D82|nr:DNA polymerase III subunit chi [Sulfitobacter sp. SK012]AXI46254.1 DNA polymerase III subunit chi [Sulfitobacter sp. SK012]
MGAAYFYHLTQRPLADTLRMLLDKSLANGWRVAVRGTDAAGLEALDQALWLGPPDSFLPHGMAGGQSDVDQPVLLGTGTDVLNGAVCVMAVQGAEVTAQEIVSLERVCILFDGHDEAALARARVQWKSLTGAGASAQYWSEESGRWEKKAEA